MSSQSQGSAEGRPDTSTPLGRALELIRLLSLTQHGIGVRDAARLTGIDKSAVSRIFAQLEDHGWAAQNTVTGAYSPGEALYAVGAALRNNDDVWEAAREQMQHLNERFNETIYLTSRLGDAVVFRDKIESRHEIRYVVELGVPFPLASGASGTAILSALPREEQERIVDQGLKAYTETSIVDRDEYMTMLEEDRAKGYSVSYGRWSPNGGGVGSPFFNSDGECIGAITISCPMYRFREADVDEMGKAVREAARNISARFGYHG